MRLRKKNNNQCIVAETIADRDIIKKAFARKEASKILNWDRKYHRKMLFVRYYDARLEVQKLQQN